MKQRGSLLITSVWMLGIFSILVSSLGFQGSQHLVLMKREKENFQIHLDFISAMNLMNQEILKDPAPYDDGLGDNWRKPVFPEPWNKRIKVEVSEEEAKINLNGASSEFLNQFLKLYEQTSPLRLDKEKWMKALLQKRLAGRIASFEELYLMEESDAGDLEKLRAYFTVYPQNPELNINTADPLILEALIQSLSGDDFAKADLIRKLSEFRKENGGVRGTFLKENLNPNDFTRILGLEPIVQMMQLVNHLLPFLTTDSATFHIELKHQLGKKAETILLFHDTTHLPQVLSWNEN